jgi:hypothetical protein
MTITPIGPETGVKHPFYFWKDYSIASRPVSVVAVRNLEKLNEAIDADRHPTTRNTQSRYFAFQHTTNNNHDDADGVLNIETLKTLQDEFVNTTAYDSLATPFAREQYVIRKDLTTGKIKLVNEDGLRTMEQIQNDIGQASSDDVLVIQKNTGPYVAGQKRFTTRTMNNVYSLNTLLTNATDGTYNITKTGSVYSLSTSGGGTLTVSNLTATTYTLQLSDAGKLIRNSANPTEITIPTNATVNFSIGTIIEFRQTGTGLIRFIFTTPVVLNVTANFILNQQYGYAKLVKVASDQWDVVSSHLSLDPSFVASTWTNSYSFGDRSATITVTKSAGITVSGALSLTVNGVIDVSGGNGFYFTTSSNNFFKFQLTTAKRFQGFKIYAYSGDSSTSSWNFEGSNDDSTWTNLSSFVWMDASATTASAGTTDPDTSQTLGTSYGHKIQKIEFTNNTNYQYYRFNCTAGSITTNVWFTEVNFKSN